MWHFRGECQCGAYRGARRKSPQLSSVTLNKGATASPRLRWAWTAHDRTVFQGRGKAKYSLFNLFSCLQDELLYCTRRGSKPRRRGERRDSVRQRSRVKLLTRSRTLDIAREHMWQVGEINIKQPPTVERAELCFEWCNFSLYMLVFSHFETLLPGPGGITITS